jgi:hypothetical protein
MMLEQALSLACGSIESQSIASQLEFFNNIGTSAALYDYKVNDRLMPKLANCSDATNGAIGEVRFEHHTYRIYERFKGLLCLSKNLGKGRIIGFI